MAGGATAAETDVSQAVGLSVTVRKDVVETIAYNRDKGIGVTVYVGQRRGHASTADFSAEAIRATVGKALAIARHTAEDPCAGTRRSGPAGPRDSRPRSLPSVGPHGRGRDPARPRNRGRGARRRQAAHQYRRLDGVARRVGIRLCQQPRLSRRLSQLAPSHRLRRDRRGRRRDAARLLVHRGARAARICRRPPSSGASPASGRCAASTRAGSARSNARCCSKRRRPPT